MVIYTQRGVGRNPVYQPQSIDLFCTPTRQLSGMTCGLHVYIDLEVCAVVHFLW